MNLWRMLERPGAGPNDTSVYEEKLRAMVSAHVCDVLRAALALTGGRLGVVPHHVLPEELRKEKQMGTIALSQNTSLDGARTFASGTVIHAYRPHEGIR